MPRYADRVKETSTTTGTGTYDLAGAATGYQTFVAGIGTGNTCYYCATDGTNWEVGIGTVTDAATDTLSRDYILASSNSGAAVSWAAGTRDIFVTVPATGILPRGYIDGLETSRASATSIGIAVGCCRDDDNLADMHLRSALTKTEAAWSVGSNAGGLDSGSSYTNSTWYYVYLIKRLDTGVVDALFSTSKTSPTLPTNYTVSRMIGMFYHATGGTTDIYEFYQKGDVFSWKTRGGDGSSTYDSTSPPTTWTLVTLGSVPPIEGVQAVISANIRDTAGSNVKSCGFQHGYAADSTNRYDAHFDITTHNSIANAQVNNRLFVGVNSSGQIKIQASTTTSIRVLIDVAGWIWSRGRT